MTEIIKFINVGKEYEAVKATALSSVTFSVNEGEFLCIVGPSGCGKSTILRLIGGIEDKTLGEIEKPEGISMVFQSGALLPWMNVEENVSLVNKIKGYGVLKVKEISNQYLKMMDLKELKMRYPRELSGGQRQRVGIARALAVEPKVLLLDEPFSALDPVTTEEMHKYLLDIWFKTGKTIIMVSHSIEEALLLADRIMVMEKGKIKQVLNVEIERPRHEESEKIIKDAEKIKKIMESEFASQ